MALAVEKYIKFCYTQFGKQLIGREADFLKAELAGRKRILDVGCGIGSLEERLSQLNIIGLDNSEAMIEKAGKRSDKKFVLGSAEGLKFPDESFDAVFYVATLEFVDSYKKAINEAVRVLESEGKLVVMMLNPKSKYFKAHIKKEDSYFRRVNNINLQEIEDYVSQFFSVNSEYFLGIKEQDIFDSTDPRFASLYVIKGPKK